MCGYVEVAHSFDEIMRYLPVTSLQEAYKKVGRARATRPAPKYLL